MAKSFSQNPLEGSICSSCRFMVRRVIIPFNEAQYGIDREALEIPEDEEVIYEHYWCSETALDLDHIVLECNCYDNKAENRLINIDL
jgi:hypothetical protein